MKSICFITILILNLDGTLYKDKYEVPIKLDTEWNEELVVKCSNEAEKIKNRISTHHWNYKGRGGLSQGYYLNDGSDRMVIGYLY